MALTGILRKLWPKWILLFLFWTIVGLAFAGQLYLSRPDIGWAFALGRALGDWYVFAVLSVPAMWVASRLPFAARRWRLALVIHLASGALFSLGWMTLRAALEHWRTRNELDPVTFGAAFNQALGATFFWNFLIYWGVVIGQHAFAYYQKFHEREVQSAELETRLTQARLQALQMQLNPHFLFNTLNAISSLMHKDVEEADRMIVHLSDLLRYALESTEAQEVPLRRELDFLDRYLQIQQARFGNRLVVRREIADETLDALVPNLVLQPLVENAIEHGIAPHLRVGEVVLRARRGVERLELEVQDNGVGLPPDKPLVDGIGLSNTRARLLQLYGSAQALQLANGQTGGLIVRVTIPWRADAAPARKVLA
jgi:signal transduction histidine kinase